MFWFSTKSDFSVTFFNNIEMVLSGDDGEPKNKVNVTVSKRNEASDEPTLIWQGELSLKSYLTSIDFVNRLPSISHYDAIKSITEYFERLSKFQ